MRTEKAAIGRAGAAALLVAGAVIGGVAAGQLGVANADSSDTTTVGPRFGAGVGADDAPRWRAGHHLGMHGALHGEFVVETEDGTYVTRVMQVGTVSAVTADTVTVVSEDGHSATYTVDDDTVVVLDGAAAELADLTTGETVRVVATGDGTALTADGVLAGDPPARGPGRHRLGGPHHLQRGFDAPAGAAAIEL